MIKKYIQISFILILTLNAENNFASDNLREKIQRLRQKNPFNYMSPEEKEEAVRKAQSAHPSFYYTISTFLRWPTVWAIKNADLKSKIDQFKTTKEIFYFIEHLTVSGTSLLDIIIHDPKFTHYALTLVDVVIDKVECLESKESQPLLNSNPLPSPKPMLNTSISDLYPEKSGTPHYNPKHPVGFILKNPELIWQKHSHKTLKEMFDNLSNQDKNR
jgi:hypothetical protein